MKAVSQDTCFTLLFLGWREGRNDIRKYARMFYKRHDTPTRCRLNDDKEGIQVCLYVSEFDGKESIEIEVSGGLSDGTWINLHNYSLPRDIHVDKVLALIPRMLTLWECAASSSLPSAEHTHSLEIFLRSVIVKKV